MPRIHVEGNALGPAVTADDESGKLVDIIDDVGAPVPFSCRGASCGTCRVEVLEGIELLEPPSSEEREVLEVFFDPPNYRLACSARVKSGLGTIRLRVIDDTSS